jgi:hypothetical protein
MPSAGITAIVKTVKIKSGMSETDFGGCLPPWEKP